jgi:protein MAK11
MDDRRSGSYGLFAIDFDSSDLQMVNVGPTVETHDRRVKKAKLDPGSKEKNVKFLASRDDNKDTATSSVPKARRRIKFAVSDEAKPASKELVTEDSIPASTFKVIVGSYEKLLYGLEGTVSSSSTGYSFHLEPIFIFPAHVSCIKAVAASPHGGKWLATGSADEIIKVWDLRRRKEIGGLMHHEGRPTYRFSLRLN